MSKESSIKVFAENASGTRPANAIPVWIDNISAIGGGGGGGGGSDFDPTYMSAQIDNKLNKSAVVTAKYNGVTYVTAISGKDLSARFASTAKYASTASTATYDDNGNYLSQTYSDLTALNQFVQTNSASWGQGGGESDVAPLGLWLGYVYSSPKAVNNTNDTYNITLRNTQWEEPSTIYYYGNSYNWNGTNGDWYIDLTTIYPNDMRDMLPYNDSVERFTVMEFTNTNTQEKYSANININTNENTRFITAYNSACVVSAKGEYASFNVDYSDMMGTHPLSSWQATNDYVSGGFTNSQATAFFFNAVNGECTAFIGFAGEGSTVASSDVFPPTNNLDPYATYYLGWNANNGGLFWYNPGNGGN